MSQLEGNAPESVQNDQPNSVPSDARKARVYIWTAGMYEGKAHQGHAAMDFQYLNGG